MENSINNSIELPSYQQNYFLSSVPLVRTEILLKTEPSYNMKDIDVVADMQKSFNHFVNSGQAWALLIGLFIGYMFRSFTSS